MTKIIDESTIIKNEYLLLFIITIIIFLLNILHIDDIGILYILDDEYGYWANAAYLSGLNWSDTVSRIPYYSYGYSLLLIPLFWIFNNTIYMYKAAIVLNSIMLSISFLLCYNIAKKIITNANKYILISVSFFISMYPTYIAYSNIAWSECLLMFVCWLLTWCFTEINENTSVYKFCLIGFLTSYIYIVHQRTLGIFIASITVIIIMKVAKKINYRQLFSYIIPIILIMILGTYIKENIQSNLWLNGKNLTINDYSGQINKINQIFSKVGLVKVIKTFIGQFFYLGVASYLLFYIGLYELIKKTLCMVKRSIRNKDSNILNYDDKIYTYIFLLLAVLSTMFISAIFFINPISIDEIVYGRYNEIILGPIILIGFTKLIENEKLSRKVFLFILLCFIIMTVIIDQIIKHSGLNVINNNTIHTFGLHLMNSTLGVYLPAAIGVALFRLIWISFVQINKKLIIVTLLIISGIFISFGEIGANSLAIQNKEMLTILKVTDIINSRKDTLPIYFLCNDPDTSVPVEWNGRLIRDRSVADCYQFLLKDKNIIPVKLDELKKVTGDKFVITTKKNDILNLKEEFELLGYDYGSFLYISN